MEYAKKLVPKETEATGQPGMHGCRSSNMDTFFETSAIPKRTWGTLGVQWSSPFSLGLDMLLDLRPFLQTLYAICPEDQGKAL